MSRRNAVVELLAGKPVTTPKTVVMGCSTKWNTKRDDIAKAEEKWKSEPVDLELIDAAGVAKLAKNDSNRLRLVNVWATWCAPCVAEFPELGKYERSMSSAVNTDYARMDQGVGDGDEVAFLPPVSGG